MEQELDLLYLPTVLQPRELMEPMRSIRRPKQLEVLLAESFWTFLRVLADRNSLMASSSGLRRAVRAACSMLRRPTGSRLSPFAGTIWSSSVCSDTDSSRL